MRKNRKSVLAKSFQTQKDDFWQKPIFEIFGRPPTFFRKTVIFGSFCVSDALRTPKSRFQSAAAPDQLHPPRPKFRGAPESSFPGSRESLGPIAAVAREKSRKNAIFTGYPHPYQKVPKSSKIAISQKLLI